ncbi:MAG: adenosylhomocysteinase [Planctomycetes bacterium]|jgi:adenosylhomocysteinase|nr:adenosylhomocysteinase [Planctomycetota bacterium]
MTNDYQVKDIGLAAEGKKQLDWAEAHMPVLRLLRERVAKEKPLSGQRIAGCLHVTKETGILVRTLAAAGAELAWSGCNPLSTQDEVAAALAAEGFRIYAWHGMGTREFYECIDRTLEIRPTLTLDDGADLIFRIHDKRPDLIPGVLGGSEETTTGVHRLRAMAKAGALRYPIVAVNDSETKWDFDNVYGTGQSSIDGILRATSVLLAGKTFVVAGYGHCGRGCAMRARGMGSNVLVTEVKATAALKAALEGFGVATMDEAAKVGDIFITATGMRDVITGRHFAAMKDGAIVCNTGHYDVEVAIKELEKLAKGKREIRPNCEEYEMGDGRRIYVLAQGRLVNLAAAEGHPSEVMDMSFANQLRAMILLAKEGRTMARAVHVLPEEIDQEIAGHKLVSMGLALDSLTKEQIAYRDAYSEGT